MSYRKLEKFVPPVSRRCNLDLDAVERVFNKRLKYAPNGRSAIYQLINANRRWTKMLLPAYLCSSVLIPLRRANVEPVFYDIDPMDLNGDLDSLTCLADEHSISVALLPSMYGNPADLERAEILCRSKGIYLIDDAAQSFGASLQNRQVGTFGNAGFFSISPGKPLAGHMGAFYWSENPIVFKPTRHDIVHYIKWVDFRIRRLNAYASSKFLVVNPLLEYGTVALTKLVDMSFDEMAPFESTILGGLLNESLSGLFKFRQRYFNEFDNKFSQSKRFSVVRSIRGTPCNHKIVVRCTDRDIALELRKFLKGRSIYSNPGYALLSQGNSRLTNAAQIDGCIVELPIENNEVKMHYLFDSIDKFDNA